MIPPHTYSSTLIFMQAMLIHGMEGYCIYTEANSYYLISIYPFKNINRWQQTNLCSVFIQALIIEDFINVIYTYALCPTVFISMSLPVLTLKSPRFLYAFQIVSYQEAIWPFDSVPAKSHQHHTPINSPDSAAYSG